MKIAGVQCDVHHGLPERNLTNIEQWFLKARQGGADLVIFPECATTGYAFSTREEAARLAEPIPGLTTRILQSLCEKHGGQIVLGMLEADGDQVYNTACHIAAVGIVATYRKIHLPYLGIDRVVDFGDRPFSVYENDGLRIGLNICYDAGFPEAARVLALQGADLIILPTNWPTGAETLADHAIVTRALENGVYYAAINRVGVELGTHFVGRSRICGPRGETLAVGSADGEEILFAEIEPEWARRKTIVRVPGEQLIDRIKDRRPEFYESLLENRGEPRPGHDIPASEFS